MKNLVWILCVGLMLTVESGDRVFAADTLDPVLGTWILNVAKSKFTGGSPQSMTRVYVKTDAGVALRASGVAMDGSPLLTQSTFKYDGKDYPYAGSSRYDSLAFTKINDTTVISVIKKAGKVVGQTTRSISEHGKVMTLTSVGTDATGMKFSDVAVYDKQ